MAVGLRGTNRSLNARQKLLRFWQGQTEARNIAKTFWTADLCQIGAQATGIILAINRNTHRISVLPVGHRPDRPYLPCRHTPSLKTLP